MIEGWCMLKMVLRAAVWKTTPRVPLLGLPGLLIWAIVAIAGGLVHEYLEAGAAARFIPYGLNAAVAWTALALAVTACFVRSEGRITVLAAILALSLLIDLVSAAAVLGSATIAFELPKPGLWTSGDSAILIFLIQLVWWIGAVLAILRSVEPERRSGRLPRTVGLWLALFLTYSTLPHEPTFRGRNFDLSSANWWEYISAALERAEESDAPPPRRVDSARVELAQPALLEAEISRLVPQVKGKTDIYAIGLAGWSDQDVFVKELNGALDSLARTLPLDGHVLRLINHPDTVETTPIASRQNFAAAVRAVARVIDRDEDVVLLFMTSHGSRGGVALRLAGAISSDLSPDDVAAVLDGEGIKNRILIVSACYSGVFLKPLANDDTIILTAADEDHSSFGCSNQREWTYFGDAFFSRSLRPGATIEEAFADAKIMIAQWEARDGLSPSNPQGHFGHALMRRLATIHVSSNPVDHLNAAASR